MKTNTRVDPGSAPASGLCFLSRPVLLLAVVVLLVLAVRPARAETLLWTNVTGGNWNVAANWEPNRVPASGDEVVATNAGTYTVTLNVNASPARLTLGAESGIQTLAIPGSTFTLQTEGRVIGNGVLALSGGTLAGSGVLTVRNVMDWTGGTMSGSGATVIAAGGTLKLSGAAQKTLSQRSVTNFGTVVWSGAGRIMTRSGAPFRNEAGGVFEVENDVGYVKDPDPESGGAGSFHNAGLFRKTGGPGTTTFQAIPFSNTGTVEALSGRLLFANGVTSSGTFLAGPGATNLFNSTCVFGEGSVFGGVGQNRLEGAMTLEGAIASENLVMVSGNWRGTNVVSGSWAWIGGTLMWPGSTTIAAGGRWDITGDEGKVLDGRSVTNLGTVVWSGAGRIMTRSGAPFRNEAGGVFEVENDVGYVKDPDPESGGAGSFHNAGLFRKTGGPGTTTFQAIPFSNTGTISVGSGTLNFSSPPTLGATTTFEIGLVGPSQTGGYGRITCSQAIQLVGHLAVTFVGGFLPGPGEDYPVIVAPIRGEIQSFSAPLISPEVFINPVYTASAVHLVTMSPVPFFGQPGTDAEGRFTLDIHGIASQWYGIEATTDFVEWAPLTTNAIPASTVWQFVDEDSLTIPYRFYRVWFEPQPETPGAP